MNVHWGDYLNWNGTSPNVTPSTCRNDAARAIAVWLWSGSWYQRLGTTSVTATINLWSGARARSVLM
jgi:hypothetical protein